MALNPDRTERFLPGRVGRASLVYTIPYEVTTTLEFARVALPLPVDRLYTYRIPGDIQDMIFAGSGVVVPFGRRMLTGVVTARAEEADLAGIEPKDIVDFIDIEPVLTEEQLRLSHWIANYYVCSWGEAIRAALPPGIDSVSEDRIARRGVPEPGKLHDRHAELLRHVPERGHISLKSLKRIVPDVSRARLRELESMGLIDVETVLRGPLTRERRNRYVRLKTSAPEDSPRGGRQRTVLKVLKEALENGLDDISQRTLLQNSGATSSTLRRLVELDYIEIESRVVDRSTEGMAEPEIPRPIELHESQRDALLAIERSVEAARYETFLLHGVTGSGKTEVYIEAMKRVRANGRSGIILVPEIALTPQTVRRFRSHFGDDIAVLHSRMSAGERYDAWRGIRSGKYPIVIGPRSAVLAPVSSLGLIVVDEEHETSYKQHDPAPRYHARDVAIFRARENNAVCVLGSATPSLESIANARRGKYSMLMMPERVPVAEGSAVLPSVRIVDMRNKRRQNGNAGIISEPLRQAIKRRLSDGQQIILLQNRRGFAPVVMCQTCGWTPECRDCSVSMTYHKAKKHLRCHYCGRTERLPETCRSCWAGSLRQLGVGTQRVEEEIRKFFPQVRVARMDLDTTSGKNAHHDILGSFGRGDADILLGTQMVAKGLDFENVTLVGVIDADSGLFMPDIRAEEKSFQLLTQVAGRAGRADLPGEVILQTRNPGHRVIQYAVRHDYGAFARDALPEREALGYPPSGRIIAVMFSGPGERELFSIAERFRVEYGKSGGDNPLLGPAPSFIGRMRKQFRAQCVVKIAPGHSHRRARRVLRKVIGEFGTLPRGYRLSVDVDPVGIL